MYFSIKWKRRKKHNNGYSHNSACILKYKHSYVNIGMDEYVTYKMVV